MSDVSSVSSSVHNTASSSCNSSTSSSQSCEPSTPCDTQMEMVYIFGKRISFSMLPTIHTAGYRYHGLPHTYMIVDVDGFAHVVRSPQFGGASVTMPHKLAVGRLCDEVMVHAKRIGAINTLIVVGEDESEKNASGT